MCHSGVYRALLLCESGELYGGDIHGGLGLSDSKHRTTFKRVVSGLPRWHWANISTNDDDSPPIGISSTCIGYCGNRGAYGIVKMYLCHDVRVNMGNKGEYKLLHYNVRLVNSTG